MDDPEFILDFPSFWEGLSLRRNRETHHIAEACHFPSFLEEFSI